jgi:hypothetical protein
MNYKIGICSNCGKETLIVNNYFKLCCNCNKSRLEKTKNNNSNNSSCKNYIKPYSNKNIKAKKVLEQVYEEINNREQCCSGCGTKNHLSRSHIIPRSRRKDLEGDIENITLYCMQRQDGSKGCHQRWEGTLEEKKTLLDFESNMEYIKEKDKEYYNLIIYK